MHDQIKMPLVDPLFLRQKWLLTGDPHIVPSVPTPDELNYIAEFPKARWATILTDANGFCGPSGTCRSGGETVAFTSGPNRILWTGESDVALLQQFFKIMQWMSEIYEWKDPIRLFYWNIHLPRQIPEKKHTPIGPYHVNGGASYVCTTAFVNVFRHEEAEKVLMHELIHAMCADVDTQSVDFIIENAVGSSNLRLPEAYTEVMAEYYYIASHCANFKKAWQEQIIHADVLVKKILTHYGRHSPLDKRMPWIENTAVFSYYVMKAVLLRHLNEADTVDKWPTWLAKYDVMIKQKAKTRRKGQQRQNKSLKMVKPRLDLSKGH